MDLLRGQVKIRKKREQNHFYKLYQGLERCQGKTRMKGEQKQAVEIY